VANIFQLHSDFSFGELSPRLLARVDFVGYHKGAEKLRNMLTLPQGGVRRRFGTEFIAAVEGPITDKDQARFGFLVFQDSAEYLLVFRSLKLDIYHLDALVATVTTPWDDTEIQNIDFAQTHDRVYIVHPDNDPEILTRTSAHTGWSLDKQVFVNKPTVDVQVVGTDYSTNDFTPAATTGNGVDISTTSAVFTSAMVGGWIAFNGGIARLNSLTSTTVMSSNILQAFTDTTTFDGNDVILTQPAYSTALGFPQSVTFYLGRLVYGGAKSFPNLLAASNTNDFDDFDDSDNFDTNGITTFIVSGSSNFIKNVTSHRSLIVTTNTSVAANNLLYDGQFTPSQIPAFPEISQEGAKNIRPLVMDGQVIYVANGGRIIRALRYDSNSGFYDDLDISVTACQLISDPRHMAGYQSPDKDDGKYIFIVNDDGTMATYISLVEQNVKSWALQDTPTATGKFRDVASDNRNTCYFLVERTIGGSQKFFIEKLNFDLFTDSAVTNTFGSDTTVITGLTHLEGETVRVRGSNVAGAAIGDNMFVLASQTVASGQITVEEGLRAVEVGLNYDPLLRLMPVNIDTQTGPDIYSHRKLINEIVVDYIDSLGILVNGQLIPELAFNAATFDDVIAPKTDFSKVEPMPGPTIERQDIDITQTAPVPMIVIGVGVKINTDLQP